MDLHMHKMPNTMLSGKHNIPVHTYTYTHRTIQIENNVYNTER